MFGAVEDSTDIQQKCCKQRTSGQPTDILCTPLLYSLKTKSYLNEGRQSVAGILPAQSPQTPIDRFDVAGKRLNAMAGAIKTVRPALADFYSSLTNEQKARFNNLKSPEATSSRRG
jgi:hypothetical protein